MRGIKPTPFALALYAVFVTAVAVMLAYASLTAPEPKAKAASPFPTAGLARFPVLDSKQEVRAPDIFIACKAYANRPSFDVTAPVTDSALGFRVVSDCRTVKS